MNSIVDLRLEDDALARNRAVSTTRRRAGSVIVSVEAFVTVLLPQEKGLRCDYCHVYSAEHCLQKCSGCASYWYCDTKCQRLQWPVHKKICKTFNHYISIITEALLPHDQLDGILLSHFLAHANLTTVPTEQSPLSVFLSLLPGPRTSFTIPPICSNKSSSYSQEFIFNVYSRFGNNNFTIHSHLTSFAHGVFPLASRLFNHSCVPNAAVRYIISRSRPVVMEIIALRDISPGEEVCIPYLDPALLQTRQKSFELTYGFRCRCASCTFLKSMGPIPDPPEDLNQVANLERILRNFVGVDPSEAFHISNPKLESMPSELLCLLSEKYLESLSEVFSQTSHEGSHDTNYKMALESGSTLVALYMLIYPPNYPQIGMHLLELAKTCWNARVACSDTVPHTVKIKQLESVRCYLGSSRQNLLIFGPEGDPGGPLEEINVLQNLLNIITPW